MPRPARARPDSFPCPTAGCNKVYTREDSMLEHLEYCFREFFLLFKAMFIDILINTPRSMIHIHQVRQSFVRCLKDGVHLFVLEFTRKVFTRKIDC